MADENTTDSTPTTTAPPAEQGSSTSSTTAPPATEQTPVDEGAGGTLLTEPKPEENTDTGADQTDDTAEGDEVETNDFLGAPEGDYQLEGLPEGTVIDEAAMSAIAPVAKELNLSNAGLSKIAAVYAEKVLPQVAESLTDNLQRDVANQHAAWAKEASELVKTDPVFNKQSLSEVQQVAAKSLDRFGGKDFREFLNITGLGNHPAMVKFAYLVGNAISEDTFERGSTAPKPKSREEKYYGAQS